MDHTKVMLSDLSTCTPAPRGAAAAAAAAAAAEEREEEEEDEEREALGRAVEAEPRVEQST